MIPVDLSLFTTQFNLFKSKIYDTIRCIHFRKKDPGWYYYHPGAFYYYRGWPMGHTKGIRRRYEATATNFKNQQNQYTMKIEQATKERIVKNVVLSLFIYLLPVALMFLTLTITGKRPWEKKTPKHENAKLLTKKTNLNNVSNN